MRPARGHKVDGFHGTQRDYPFVTTGITHHTDGFLRNKDRKGLRGFVVPASVVQFFNKDGIGFTQNIGVFFFHFAQNAHAQARARERMAVHHVVGQPQFQADFTHFVFKQFAQRFDQRHFHIVRQTADVMVRFNHMGFAGFGGG